jgi:hypothetical protein
MVSAKLMYKYENFERRNTKGKVNSKTTHKPLVSMCGQICIFLARYVSTEYVQQVVYIHSKMIPCGAGLSTSIAP